MVGLPDLMTTVGLNRFPFPTDPVGLILDLEEETVDFGWNVGAEVDDVDSDLEFGIFGGDFCGFGGSFDIYQKHDCCPYLCI